MYQSKKYEKFVFNTGKRHQKHECYTSKAKQFFFSGEIGREGNTIPVDKID